MIYKTRAMAKKGFLQYLFRYFSLYPGIFFSIFSIMNRFKNLLKTKNLPYLNRFPTLNIKQQSSFLQVYSKLKPRGRIALFSGCSSQYLMPSITEALIYILNWLNYEVIVPKQHCCGAPLLSAGFEKEAKKLARKNLEIYKSFNIDGIITPCPTCAHFIRDVYKEITGEGLNVLKFADLFEENLKEFKGDDRSNVFFHISCHTSNYVNDSDKTLKLLKKFGINAEKKTGCCGFGGLFSFLFEKQSMDILRKKVLEYEKADMIISSCPNCIIQFKSAMKDKKILHYAEVIQKILFKGEKYGRAL
ncbi:(Fe-S)-binding protein [Thermodesulfovibrio sp. 3907-1M]|uniref:(Fe-S)-binding protein n=1 Tax=Thermodesulfovibrio autotrophicus TaxID=3118333 RepID=A0AAU8GXK1_9BACT